MSLIEKMHRRTTGRMISRRMVHPDPKPWDFRGVVHGGKMIAD